MGHGLGKDGWPSDETVIRYECPGCGHEYTEAVSSCDCLHKPVEFNRIEYFRHAPDSAARIAELEAENAALRSEVERLRTGFDRFLGSCEECTDQDGWLAFMCSADDFNEAQSVLEEGENDET